MTEQVEEQVEETSDDQPGDKAERGTKFVEFDEETQKRFNKIWGNMKQYERTASELAKFNKTLIEKFEALETEFKGQKSTQIVSELKDRKKAALEEGDFAKAEELDEQIYQARKDAEKPAEKIDPPKEEANGFQLTPEEQTAISAWAQERNENGSLKRPWADPGHPQHQRVLKTADAVLADPDFQGATLTDVLKEVDRIMSPSRPQQAAVLSADANVRKTSKKVSLTAEQKHAAEMMGVSEDKYLKVLEMTR